MLKARIEALEAEEYQLEHEAVADAGEAVSATEVTQWGERLPDLLVADSAQLRKALLRKLIQEIRVMSRDEIVPTYRSHPWFAQCQVQGPKRTLREPAQQLVPTQRPRAL